MPSIVWNRHPEEAYRNPYEYAAQEQFVREALNLLKSLFANYEGLSMVFPRDDKSLRKAIWMLQIDALDSLRDCLESLTLVRACLNNQDYYSGVEILHAGLVGR